MRKVVKFGLPLAPIPVVAALAVVWTVGAGAARPAAAQAAVGRHSAPMIRVRDGRNSQSTNWSGYATTGGSYTDVKGSWTQPSATCSAGETAYSSFWVGIDGDTTNTVEQTGTDADCSSGAPTYYAWYEMYPKFPVNFSNPVLPGDAMSAEVSTSGRGSFTLTISDATRHWTQTVNQSSRKARLGSAEWIAEAPSSSGGVLPLADFGTVSFSNCSANGLPISQNPSVDEIVMVTSSGTVKAQPSGLNAGGTGFSDTWNHS
jgi:hypothetical protein